jgi:hypothetical protein
LLVLEPLHTAFLQRTYCFSELRPLNGIMSSSTEFYSSTSISRKLDFILFTNGLTLNSLSYSGSSRAFIVSLSFMWK